MHGVIIFFKFTIGVIFLQGLISLHFKHPDKRRKITPGHYSTEVIILHYTGQIPYM